MALDTFINGERKQTAKKRGETLRFELELAPPTEETTNEWSYEQLVDEKLKKVHARSFLSVISSFEYGKRLLKRWEYSLVVVCGIAFSWT